MSVSRETLASLSYKLGTIGCTFFSVALLVHHMGPTSYGAWATLVSALVWIQLSDLGIGIVVRNRVAADRSDPALAQIVATAITLTGVIALVFIVAYAVAWRHVSVARDYPLESALLYVSAFLMLPTGVGTNILQGLGMTRVTFKAAFLQTVLWVAFVACLGQRPAMLPLAVGFSTLWAGVCLFQMRLALRETGLANAVFLARLVNVRPSRDVMTMMRIGAAFFILQMTSLVLFNLGTYLSYDYFSPAAAARYDILNKVYQIPLTLFNVVIVVAWSRITRDAQARDAHGLHRIQVGLLAVAVAGAAALFLVSGFVVRPFVSVYSHGQIEVSGKDVMAFSILVAIQLVAYVGAVFMNATERLRIQLLFALASAAAFVPVFLALRSAGFDVASVPLATGLVMLPGGLWFNVHVRRHIIRPLRSPAGPVDAPPAAALHS
jgi:O-antigen/teichoic acid export membrane protein